MTKKKHTLHQNRVPYLLHINPTTRGGTLTNKDNKIQSNDEDCKYILQKRSEKPVTSDKASFG